MKPISELPRITIHEVLPVSTPAAFEQALLTAEPDPIQEANDRFKRDVLARPDMKLLNLGIGVIIDQEYADAWVPEPIAQVDQELGSRRGSRGYLSSPGLTQYLHLNARRWVFGDEVWQELGGSEAEKRPEGMVWAQTVGGVNAVRLAYELAQPQSNGNVFFETPTWPPYYKMTERAGFQKIITYGRRNPDNNTWYNHEGFIEAVEHLPKGTLIVVQASGYNGDGVDRTDEQWNEFAQIAGQNESTVIVDMAYNGLVRGHDSGLDNYAVRALATAPNVELYVCVSDSKKNGQYDERLGALYILLRRSRGDRSLRAQRIQNYLASELIRPWHSNPPRRPAVIAQRVMEDDVLHRSHIDELDRVRESVLDANRNLFAQILAGKTANIAPSNGLFATLFPAGLSQELVRLLREEHGHYWLANSRVNFGGMTLEEARLAAQTLVSYL